MSVGVYVYEKIPLLAFPYTRKKYIKCKNDSNTYMFIFKAKKSVKHEVANLYGSNFFLQLPYEMYFGVG